MTEMHRTAFGILALCQARSIDLDKHPEGRNRQDLGTLSIFFYPLLEHRWIVSGGEADALSRAFQPPSCYKLDLFALLLIMHHGIYTETRPIKPDW